MLEECVETVQKTVVLCLGKITKSFAFQVLFLFVLLT